MAKGKKSKYNAKTTVVNGVKFDSKKEASRWVVLQGMEQLGAISGLQRQVKYELIPKQLDPVTGKVRERACSYVADFVYYDADGRLIVEDSKGMAKKTPEYIIKRKLMLERYGIIILET